MGERDEAVIRAAHNLGVLAALQGKKTAENPYGPGRADLSDAWEQGWMHETRALQEQEK